MKLLATLMMVMALGLCAYGQPIKDAIDSELTELCERDMDQCLQIVRSVKQLYQTAVDAEADAKKRFLFEDTDTKHIDNLKSILAFLKLKETVDKLLEKANGVFTQLTSRKLDFKETVQKLISKIQSNPTVAACKAALKKYATFILGAFSSDEEALARLLCNTALLKIEETVG